MIHFHSPGAEAYRRDISSAKAGCFDTGHFALEIHGEYLPRN